MVETEWRPIETAPRDNTRVLLAWWDGPAREWVVECRPYSNLDVARPGMGYAYGRAEYWMPIPALPTETRND